VDREGLEVHAGQRIADASCHRPRLRSGTVLEPAYPLRTTRLDLRPYEPSDLEHVRAMYGRADVHRYLYTEPMGEDELLASLEKKIPRRAWGLEGSGLNLLGVLRDTGDVVGDVALWLVSEEHRTGEVGFVLKPEFTGHGYATEMAAEMLRVGFDEVGLHRVVGRLDARNAGSAAVLERLGMRREALLVDNEWVKGERTSELDYALLADEWATSPVSRSSA
jgi:RimJ/RimL family protein N-acetyltransferase